MKTILYIFPLVLATIYPHQSHAQGQPTEIIAGHWKSDAQFIIKDSNPEPIYFWVGKIEGEITPTGRLALAAGNGCKLVGLLAPTPNIKGKFKGVANLTQCPDKLLNRTYNVDAFDIKGNLKLTASTKEIVASKIRATYDISTTLVRR